MPLVSAGIGVEYDDAVIAVTIGDVDLIGRRVDFGIGGPTQTGRIAAPGLRAGLADLQHELSVLGEFQHMAIVVAVAPDPDEAFVIDIDAMLILEPVVALPGSAPCPEQIAVLVELHHGRRRHAAFRPRRTERRRFFIIGKRARPLDNPDMILRVDRHACGLSHDPVIRQRLGPGRVDLELRQVVG
jgi:hypothetical protein